MQVDYSKLWQILAKKQISKTELSSLTGLSSRTVAKLSANKDVNTDTLARICAVLQCDVSDIMSFTSETPSSLYSEFGKSTRIVSETEYVVNYECSFENKEYFISVTKQSANKYTVVKCKNSVIMWEQIPSKPFLAGRRYGDDVVIYQVPPLKDGKIHLFVVSGIPASIEGLDDGIFRSSRHLGGEKYIHVMSLAAFKLFVNNAD